MLSDLKYNYVILGSEGYYEVGYHDIMAHPKVSYFTSLYEGNERFPWNFLVRLNFSRKLNRYIKTPFKRLVYPRIYKHNFPEDKPICYLFFESACDIFKSSYLEYLKRKYKDVRFVLYYQDIVARAVNFDAAKANAAMDLLVTYDKGDSIKYNMAYHPTPMSFVKVAEDNTINNSDVYYCGIAKTRYPIIHEIFKKLTEKGLRCDFNIMCMPDGVERVKGINYSDRFFTYYENLQHIQKTKCILEIMQEGAEGFTPRLWESIIYDKCLITNNQAAFNSEYYYDKGMLDLEGMDMVDIKNWLSRPILYPQSLKRSLSPFNLLCFIDNLLKQI